MRYDKWHPSGLHEKGKIMSGFIMAENMWRQRPASAAAPPRPVPAAHDRDRCDVALVPPPVTHISVRHLQGGGGVKLRLEGGQPMRACVRSGGGRGGAVPATVLARRW